MPVCWTMASSRAEAAYGSTEATLGGGGGGGGLRCEMHQSRLGHPIEAAIVRDGAREAGRKTRGRRGREGLTWEMGGRSHQRAMVDPTGPRSPPPLSQVPKSHLSYHEVLLLAELGRSSQQREKLEGVRSTEGACFLRRGCVELAACVSSWTPAGFPTGMTATRFPFESFVRPRFGAIPNSSHTFAGKSAHSPRLGDTLSPCTPSVEHCDSCDACGGTLR